MSDKYETKDLGEASALITKGLKFETDFNGAICWFLFEDVEKATAYSKEYYYGELLVDARRFKETTLRLVQIIKNQRFHE